jgi:LysM repeat protein
MGRASAMALAIAAAMAMPVSASADGRYVVRYGDTLSGIALAHGTSLAHLAGMNHRSEYGLLRAGTLLRVPSRHPEPHTHGYTVRFGDTLSGIAARYEVGVDELAAANNLRVNGILPAGITLAISSSRRSAESAAVYRVVPGDTLSGIAGRFGVDMNRLARLSALHVGGVLFAGITLRIPARFGDSRPPVPTAPWSVVAAIDYWCAHYGVDARFARAIAWQESGFQVDVTSSAGAWGPMQVIPRTWRRVERVLIGHPVARTGDGGIRVGVALLHHLLRVFGGNERLAAAAYYEGARALRAHGMYPETRHYVADVLALRGRV